MKRECIHASIKHFASCFRVGRKLGGREHGATAVEYALLVGVVAVGMVASVGAVRTKINTTLGKVLPIQYSKVSTLAGTGMLGTVDGAASTAQFNQPFGLALDGSGNIFVSDHYGHKIRKISASGDVSTVAGSGSPAFADGASTTASFRYPAGLLVSGSDLYVADYFNHRIRKVAADGTVTTIAGSTAGCADGSLASATFNRPIALVEDPSGALFVLDSFCNKVRKIAGGVVSTFAGSGTAGFLDGTGTAASFRTPENMSMDLHGNLLIADALNHAIRKITPSGVVTTVAGTGTAGTQDGPALGATFNRPEGVIADASGTLYVSDFGNHRIRKIADGTVSTVSGSTAGGLDGPLETATFNYPCSLALAPDGSILVAGYRDGKVRKIET